MTTPATFWQPIATAPTDRDVLVGRFGQTPIVARSVFGNRWAGAWLVCWQSADVWAEIPTPRRCDGEPPRDRPAIGWRYGHGPIVVEFRRGAWRIAHTDYDIDVSTFLDCVPCPVPSLEARSPAPTEYGDPLLARLVREGRTHETDGERDHLVVLALEQCRAITKVWNDLGFHPAPTQVVIDHIGRRVGTALWCEAAKALPSRRSEPLGFYMYDWQARNGAPHHFLPGVGTPGLEAEVRALVEPMAARYAKTQRKQQYESETPTPRCEFGRCHPAIP